jgi:hypothetical protein
MCSPSEIEEVWRSISPFEMDTSQSQNEVPPANPDWAIRTYLRPAADVEVGLSEVMRPLPIISMTLDYILDEIIDAD